MKIRQKFTIIMLFIGLVPMFVVSVFAYLSASDSLLLKSVDQLNSVAAKQADRINAIVQGEQEQTTKIANQYDLRLGLTQYMASPTAANKTRLNAIMQDAKANYPTMQYLRLFDTSGNLIASSIAEQASSDFIAKLIMPGTGDVNNVRVVRDSRDNLMKVEVSTRINASMLVSAVFRTDDLTAVMQDYTGLDHTGETMLAGDDKSLFPLRFNTDGALKVDLSNFPAIPTASGYGSVTDYRNQQVLYVTESIGVSNWRLIAKVDRDEALASTASLRTTMGGIIAFAAVFITLMAYYDMRALTRPILVMDRVARLIGNGDFSVSVNSKRKDEMGTLGRSIDAMKDNLSNLIHGIESQRVRLEIILNTTTEGIFAVDDSAVILLANHAAERLVGGTAKDLIGKPIAQIFSWEHGMQPFTVDYQQTEIKTYENLRYTDMKGNVHYVKLIVAPVHGEGAEQAGRTHAIVTIHDETSSRELENMKTDFVSMAAHELRTPLTAVRGYLEMASSKDQSHAVDSAEYVGKALKNVNELSGLINNLLDVTRIERGTLILNMEKVDFAACITRAIDDAAFAAKERTIALSYEGPHSDKWVVGDEIALREIVNNLLSNAIKYTLPGGKVQVSLVEENNRLALKVKDNGVGISKEAQKYLFNKFYRVHGGLDSGSKGTGLGLYIAKSIAERHSGTISVESDTGKGSLFTLSLPVFDQKQLDGMQTSSQETGKEIRRKRGWVTKNITR
ncbi:MAG TPA: ATP-binding protein [Candidatus Saccharimonadales bacterium]